MKLMCQQKVRALHNQELVIRCSGMDAIVQAVPVSLVIFYKETLPATRMLEALPALLDAYPLFAGRLGFDRDRLRIDCRKGHVPMEIVEREDTLEQALVRLGSGSTQDCAIHISASAALTGRAPAVALRVSQFKGGGSCLSIGFHHSIGDGQTVLGFLGAWGDLVSGRVLQPPTLPEDRHAYVAERVQDSGIERPGVRRVGPAELMKLLLIMARNPWDTKHAVFYFSDDEVERMQRALSEQAGQFLTNSDALCGHLFSSILKLSQTNGQRRLSVVINWRKRVGLPERLLGNMISTLNVQAQAGSSAASIATALRRSINDYTTHHMDYFCNERFIDSQGGHKRASRIMPTGLDPAHGTLLISNLRNIGFYDIDFDGARPLYAGVLSAAMPYMSLLSEGFQKRGTLYSVFLPASVWRSLRSDEARRELHRYRARDEEHSELVKRLQWIN